MKKIIKIRKEIDKIDKELIKVLKKRIKITDRVALLKKKYNLYPQDKKREKLILQARKRYAEKYGVDTRLIDILFKDILIYVVKRHGKIMRNR